MEPKRPKLEKLPARCSNSFSGLIDDDLRSRLASIGPRARKHVSEGHITATNIPSFEGLTAGSLNQKEIRDQYLQEVAALPVTSAGGISSKRMRYVDGTNEYGDTENDEPENDASMIDNDHKLYHKPNSHRPLSSRTDDFEEADILRPR